MVVIRNACMFTNYYTCDLAWENRPLCYNYRFRDIGHVVAVVAAAAACFSLYTIVMSDS